MNDSKQDWKPEDNTSKKDWPLPPTEAKCPYCTAGNHHLCMAGFGGGCQCECRAKEAQPEPVEARISSMSKKDE